MRRVLCATVIMVTGMHVNLGPGRSLWWSGLAFECSGIAPFFYTPLSLPESLNAFEEQSTFLDSIPFLRASGAFLVK